MDNYISLINKELGNLFSSKNPKTLYQPATYFFGIGGKRIRPLLVLLAAELNNASYLNAFPQALGIEVFHNFTLLHDDIMDNADVRRGKESIHKKWNANQAILSGDVMFAKSIELISDCSAEILPYVLKCFNKAAIEVCEGQQMDMDFENRNDISVTEYLEMIKLKTAVLIGASLKIGAICGNMEINKASYLYQAGVQIGIAFQIQDDYLDVFGNPEKFGKKQGGDILAKKKTFLYLTAKEKSPEFENKYTSVLSSPSLSDDEKVSEILTEMIKIGVKEETEKMMKSYLDKSFETINSIDCNPQKKDEIITLFKSFIYREN
jgi:geranylgeranyl diphosphate synthase type II